MITNDRIRIFAALCCALISLSCNNGNGTCDCTVTQGNPYLPLWEHIPDGEPYVFEDPDQPGKYRAYIYGSHDVLRTEYCGYDLVLWSAPVDSLNCWRYDGVILTVERNAKGEAFYTEDRGDILYAPDVAMTTDENGKKTYYLYPNDQAWERHSLVAKSDRPDGPFEICNWDPSNPDQTKGLLTFDPAVLVDDDGRVYGYWGFDHSYGAELNPDDMATLKPGTEVVDGMIPSRKEDDIFRFYEASSIRKIEGKYVFIYSRWTKDGDFGLPNTNYTLAYAYSDHPLGPWTYGGTIIDARGREVNEAGENIASATVSGNTHGSICKIKDQWYVFYHRQTGVDEFARQPMVAAIDVKVEPGPGGRVLISEGEYNSEGFSLDGLNPLERHSAGLACWYTASKVSEHAWPVKTYFGSYVASAHGTDSNYEAPYDIRNNTNPVVNNNDGSIVGYKYFNFSEMYGCNKPRLLLRLIPEGVDGTIQIMLDRPWESQGGTLLGSAEIKAKWAARSRELRIDLPGLEKYSGKHAIYFKFFSDTKEKSICTLEDFAFAL
ncbi:MAG: family 43 glycosylhydrolase [Bacteroidales bacterium]|nr:family 43 glycosylhydrolase [Bacteroidales bacterium]